MFRAGNVLSTPRAAISEVERARINQVHSTLVEGHSYLVQSGYKFIVVVIQCRDSLTVFRWPVCPLKFVLGNMIIINTYHIYTALSSVMTFYESSRYLFVERMYNNTIRDKGFTVHWRE